VLYMAKNGKQLEPKLHNIPQDIDDEVSRLKLEAMGIEIDVLSDEQSEYLRSM
jgi:adenosylhomocysteinase